MHKNKAMLKSRDYLIGLIFLVLIYSLSYATMREQSILVLSYFAFLFVLYFYFWKNADRLGLKALLLLAITARFILLFSLPNLSDDYFRFLWDGYLWNHGINAFSVLPSEALKLNIPEINSSLHNQLNSPNYFTIYPAVCQFIFFISTGLFTESVLGAVVVMKSFIFLFELGSIWLIIKLLQHFNLPKKQVLLYALNPLIVIELVGNMHFEAGMVFFTLAAIYFLLVKNSLFISAIFMALAIHVKLIPLLFIPLLFNQLEYKNWIKFGFITAMFTLLISVFLFGNWQNVLNFYSSVQLYFGSFEFNASIYYLLREIGFWISGFNQIAIIGKVLSVATLLIIIYLSLQQKIKETFTLLTFALCIYFFLSTTVHPWYVVSLVAFCCFTQFKFPVIWSGLTVFSYITYRNSNYEELLWLTAFCYLILVGYIVYEWKLWRQRTIQGVE